MIQLNRHKTFLFFAGLLVLLKFVPALTFLATASTRTGVVTHNHVGQTHVSDRTAITRNIASGASIRSSTPVAVYEVDGEAYLVHGPVYHENTEPEMAGDTVTIIYQRFNPAWAYFYTATGYWFSHYLYWLFALAAIVCACYTFIDRTQLLILRYKPRRGEKRIELTPSEKTKSLHNWIRKSLRNSRRR